MKKWQVLFNKTRKRFLTDITDIPISNTAVRLRRLDRMSVAAEARGNFVLAAALLEQAAKEVGGSFTNRRQIMGRDGRPVASRDLNHMSDEQLGARIVELLGADGLTDLLQKAEAIHGQG